MTDVWPSIQIIFELKELFTRCREMIEEHKATLKTKPIEAIDMIKVLNSKKREELEEISIYDITATILEIKEVLQKKNLINHLESKCQTLDTIVKIFHLKFNILNPKGLPGLVGLNDKLIKLEDYCEELYAITVDRTKFAGVKEQITGKDFLEALEFDLTIMHEIKHLFLTKPNFKRYIEVDETFIKMLNVEIPSEEIWDKLCETI